MFWAVLVAGNGLFFHLIVIYTLNNKRLANWPRIQRLLLGCFIASFPGVLVFLAVDYWFRGLVYIFPHHLYLWLTVFVIGTGIAYANFMPPFAKLSKEAKNSEIDLEKIPFLRRISNEIGYSLISLSMQDHYVEVITSKGRELVHLTFADAIRELKNYPGTQIHRSHWISNDAISSLSREGRATFVETIDGRKLPISAPHQKRVNMLIANKT
ncbi:MAG: LytTR family transcriptional regulator [Devosiaceae bacterium]|nr:LytTR family transcriptional regulator [Devosiaceae bacterium]